MAEIAIIGTPNCGKTTLFNRLTGTRQRTGNWPGVTVERKDGTLTLEHGERIQVVDLPGVYSLHDDIQGAEARVAQQYLREHKPDLVVVVLDATRLPRQLSLLPDILATGRPVLLVVNMLDTAAAEGIDIDLEALAQTSGLPVCGIVAATGTGLAELKSAIQSLQQAYPALPADIDINQIALRSYRSTGQRSRTEQIDRWVLHPWLSIPMFLLVMYLLFTISVNVGAIFIDFFDIAIGALLVDGSAQLLNSLGAPEWLREILSTGLGGGVQLVATFIPVIGCLYLCMSVLEDSGYLSRAAFVIDRVMAKVGLPGQAFIPLIIGFGCNVPSVMAARGLSHASARLTTIFIAPFMSCGARLSVYVFVGTAFFPDRAQNAIFALYLLGIIVAMVSAWVLRHRVFGRIAGSTITEMPAYHRPLLRNVLTQTWHRLYSFIWRAGKRILLVVLVLNVMSSVGTDGSWGNQSSEKSVLSQSGKWLTPLFEPIGIGEGNWPATVGLFTGLFAKEVVVGTLDSLYQDDTETEHVSLPIAQQLNQALQSIADNAIGLIALLNDPLGLRDAGASTSAPTTSPDAMHAAFPSAWAAFCFLVFVLLYSPCVATLAAMHREAGPEWLGYSVTWSLTLSYWLASNLWHASQLLERPLPAISWILISTVGLYAFYRIIMGRLRRATEHLIPVTNL